MADKIALIAIDWGTTNRRAWALASDGRILDERGDAAGLLAVARGGFLQSFTDFTTPWREEAPRAPALLCGMVGSKLGWIEAPYLPLPADIDGLAGSLCKVPDADSVWIVPGVSDDRGGEPDVMRGEECQILGAMLSGDFGEAILLLPGTHSKWAIVEGGRLIRFRTYLTGEIFSMLRNSGTIAQLMEPGDHDPQAFDLGVARSLAEDSLLHTLFAVRTLGLFDRMPRQSLASYLSGLLIGAEFRDALHWVGRSQQTIVVGSSQLLARYGAAAVHANVKFYSIASGTILPQALFRIARKAGLIKPGS